MPVTNKTLKISVHPSKVLHLRSGYYDDSDATSVSVECYSDIPSSTWTITVHTFLDIQVLSQEVTRRR